MTFAKSKKISKIIFKLHNFVSWRLLILQNVQENLKFSHKVGFKRFSEKQRTFSFANIFSYKNMQTSGIFKKMYVLCKLSSCPVLAVKSWPSWESCSPGWPIRPTVPDQSHLSCPDCPVMTVLPQVSHPSCPIPAVLALLLYLGHPVLSFCLGCIIPTVLSGCSKMHNFFISIIYIYAYLSINHWSFDNFFYS
jgi:hypothetical protein